MYQNYLYSIKRRLPRGLFYKVNGKEHAPKAHAPAPNTGVPPCVAVYDSL